MAATIRFQKMNVFGQYRKEVIHFIASDGDTILTNVPVPLVAYVTGKRGVISTTAMTRNDKVITLPTTWGTDVAGTIEVVGQ